MVSQVSAQLVLAAKTGPELPSIDDFLPDPILFGAPFAINVSFLFESLPLSCCC